MDSIYHANTAHRARRCGLAGLMPGRLLAKRPSWRHLVLLATLWAMTPPTRAAVDPLSGSFSLAQTDIHVQYRSLQIEVVRQFNSQMIETASEADAWFFDPLDRRLLSVGEAEALFVQDRHGLTEFNRPRGSAELRSENGQRLIKQGDTFSRLLPDGVREVYDRQGTLASMAFPDGSSLSFVRDGKSVVVRAGQVELLRCRYGESGRLERIESRSGAAAVYERDEKGRLTRATNAVGIATEFRYDDAQRVTSAAFQTGDFVRVAYDEATGRAVQTAKRGGETSYEYDLDTEGRVVGCTVVTPSGTETYAVSDDGNTIEHADVQGCRTVRHYRGGLLIRQVDARGGVLHCEYDDLGRLVALRNPDGSNEAFSYLGQTSLPVRWVLSDGVAIEYTYNAKKQLTRVRGPGKQERSYGYNTMGLVEAAIHGHGEGAFREQYRYDEAGQMVSASDSVGRTTRYAYDGMGRTVESVDPLGAVTRYKYDRHGLLAEISEDGLVVYAAQYDENLQLVEERGPRGLATQYTYDESGGLRQVKHPTGVVAEHVHDASGLLRSSQAASWASSRLEYDARGLLAAEVDEGQTARYGYNRLGSLTALTGPAGTIQWRYNQVGLPALSSIDGLGWRMYKWDPLGRLTEEEDCLGHVRKYTYDPTGNLLSVVSPGGARTQYTYDASGLGHLCRAQTSDGREYRYAHDGAGRLIRSTTPWAQVREYAYDAGDNVILESSTAGSRITYKYDRAGRLVELATSDDYHAAFTYDKHGDLVRVTANDFDKKLRYDRFGRLVAEEYPLLSQQVRYGYDGWGRRTWLEVPGHLKVAYEYDALGRLVRISYGKDKDIRFRDDAIRLQRKVSYPNGVAVVYSYGPRGRLTAIEHRGPGGTVLGAYRYEHDAVGRVVSITDAADRTRRFQYGPAGQLIQAAEGAQETSFRYGPCLSRVSETAADKTTIFRHNAAGQMMQAGETTLAYDAAGQLSQRTRGKEKIGYRFDALGRLTGVQSPDRSIRYAYCPDGQRLAKSIGDQTKHYVYDGADLLMVLDDSGRLVQTFIHGPGIDEPLAVLGKGGPLFYLPDHLGSVTALADAEGKVVARYEYQPFGALRCVGDAAGNPFTFTGRFFDAETGLYYCRARYYDPALGIFLSPDPLEKDPTRPEDFAEYAYAGNDPVNATDPSGCLTYSPTEINRIVISDAKWYMHLQRKFGPALARHWAQSARNRLLRSYLPRVVRPGQVNRALMQTGQMPRMAARASGATRIARVSQVGRGLRGAGQAGGRTGLGGLLRRAGQRYVNSPLRQRLLERPWTQKLLEQARKAPKATVVLTAVGSGLTGYNIGTRYVRKANAEGRKATAAEWAAASAEASARAAAGVVTLGASEGALEVGSKASGTYQAHKALNRYAQAKRKLDEAAAKKKAATQPARLAKRSKDLLGEMKAVQAKQERAIARTKQLLKRARDCLARANAGKPVPQPTITEEDRRKTQLNTDVLTAHEDDSRHLKGEVITSHDTAKKEAGLAMLEAKADEARPHVVAAIRAAEKATKDAEKMAVIAKQAKAVKAQVDAWAGKASAYRTKHGPAVTDLLGLIRELQTDIAGCSAEAWKQRAVVRGCPAEAKKILTSFKTVYELVRKLEGTEKDAMLENEVAAERIAEEISKSATKVDLLARDTELAEKQALAKIKALDDAFERSMAPRRFVPLPRPDLVADLEAAASAAEIFAARARAFADQARQYLASLPGGKEMLAALGGVGTKPPADETEEATFPDVFAWPKIFSQMVKPGSGVATEKDKWGDHYKMSARALEDGSAFVNINVWSYEEPGAAKKAFLAQTQAAQAPRNPNRINRITMKQSANEMVNLWLDTGKDMLKLQRLWWVRGWLFQADRCVVAYQVNNRGRWPDDPATETVTEGGKSRVVLGPLLRNQVDDVSSEMSGHSRRAAKWLAEYHSRHPLGSR